MTIGYVLKVEVCLASDGTTFTELTSDVAVVTPIDVNIGIPSADVNAHTAQPGTLTLFFKNQDNGAGLQGLYSPEHANCLAGFEIGKRIRFTADSDVLFNGWIDDITPMPGTLGPRLTKVSASDWIRKAANQKLTRLDVATAVKSETVAATIVGGVNVAPIATSYGTGQETFAYALDDCKDEKTTALTALDKVAKSEFGWIYCKADGTLRFDNRNTRLTQPSWKHTFTEDEWQSLDVERSAHNIYNWLEVTTSPRTVGTSYETLWSLNTATPIAPGATLVLRGNYSDPNQQVARVSANHFPCTFNTKNWCKNPSFEVNVTDDMTLAGAGAVAARDGTQYKVGSYSAKLTAGSAASTMDDTTGVSVADGATATIHGWVRWDGTGNVAAGGLRLRDTTSGINRVSALNSTVADTWEYVTGSWTNDTGNPATCVIRRANPNTDSTAVMWFDACQLELQTTASPYCDGDQGEGFAWDGTAHNSTSTCGPVAGTDYNFSSGTTDTGDMNSSLRFVGTDYGSNAAEFTLQNTSASTGYVTKLKVRGYAIRLFDPVVSKSTDTASLADYGKHLWQYDMPWQQTAAFGQSIADQIKLTFKGPHNLVKAMIYVPDTQTLSDLAKTITVGDGIKVSSPLNGIDAQGYFVNGIHWSIKKGNNVTVTYTLGLSFVGVYWELGTAGKGELDQTAWLAF